MSNEQKSPFNPDGGKFAENIRSIAGDDADLRESMKNAGWIEHLPAFVDENDVVIVGHRRIKIAKELNIKPVIMRLTFGNGGTADIKRLQLAIASNTGGKGLSQSDRKRIAEHLYGKQGWTMERISEALNVSPRTISEDLRNFEVPSKLKHAKTASNSKGAGRPKSAKKKPLHLEERNEKIVALADAGKSAREIASEVGVHQRTVSQILEHEDIKREAKADPDIDRADLSMTAQEKLDAAVRQHQRKLDLAFEQRVLDEIKKRIDEMILPAWKKDIDRAQELYNRRKGLMTKEAFNTIRRALHPDSRLSISEKKLSEAFDAFMELEKFLLDEKDSPTLVGAGLPRTMAEWNQRKAATAAERKSKRAFQHQHQQIRPR